LHKISTTYFPEIEIPATNPTVDPTYLYYINHIPNYSPLVPIQRGVTAGVSRKGVSNSHIAVQCTYLHALDIYPQRRCNSCNVLFTTKRENIKSNSSCGVHFLSLRFEYSIVIAVEPSEPKVHSHVDSIDTQHPAPRYLRSQATYAPIWYTCRHLVTIYGVT